MLVEEDAMVIVHMMNIEFVFMVIFASGNAMVRFSNTFLDHFVFSGLYL